MKRQSSHIKLNRTLVERYGHFPAMVLDCLRNRIEIYLAAEDGDDRYFRESGGLVYVKASGTFISNWIMCDRSTARKALVKLHKSGVINQDFPQGRNGGAWYAFTLAFIKSSTGFFDVSVKRHLLIAGRKSDGNDDDYAGDISPASGVLIPTGDGDNIPTSGDLIPTSGDNIPTGPIYNTKTTTPHPPEAGGCFDDSFLSERDAPFRRQIADVLATSPDDPASLACDQLGWKRCRPQTKQQLASLAGTYGMEIYAAAVVMAAAEHSLTSPISFIGSVCQRLKQQHVEAHRRRSAPGVQAAARSDTGEVTRQSPPPRSGLTPAEILGGSAHDEKTWARYGE